MVFFIREREYSVFIEHHADCPDRQSCYTSKISIVGPRAVAAFPVGRQMSPNEECSEIWKSWRGWKTKHEWPVSEYARCGRTLGKTIFYRKNSPRTLKRLYSKIKLTVVPIRVLSNYLEFLDLKATTSCLFLPCWSQKWHRVLESSSKRSNSK